MMRIWFSIKVRWYAVDAYLFGLQGRNDLADQAEAKVRVCECKLSNLRLDALYGSVR